MNTLDAALEYLDRGWAIIPIRKGEKVPAVKWGKYVDSKTLPSEDEVIGWFTKWPDASVAVLSGELSNLVIVDCDNQAAMDAAESYGLTKSPVRVRTKKGYHYYYSTKRRRMSALSVSVLQWDKHNAKYSTVCVVYF